MSNAQGTIQNTFSVFATLFQRLSRQLAPASAPAFFAEIGIPLSPTDAGTLAGSLNAVTGALAQLAESHTDLETAVEAGDADTVIAKTTSALAALAKALQSLPQLSQAVGGLNLPGVTPQIIDDIPGRIINQLIVDYLGQVYAVNEAFEFTGILERTDINVNSVDPNLPFYTMNTFHFDKLTGWLTSPSVQLKTLYDWGNPAFDGSKLLAMLDRLFAQLGFPVLLERSGSIPMLDLVDAVISPSTAPSGLSVRVDTNMGSGAVELSGPSWMVTAVLVLSEVEGTCFIFAPDIPCFPHYSNFNSTRPAVANCTSTFAPAIACTLPVQLPVVIH